MKRLLAKLAAKFLCSELAYLVQEQVQAHRKYETLTIVDLLRQRRAERVELMGRPPLLVVSGLIDEVEAWERRVQDAEVKVQLLRDLLIAPAPPSEARYREVMGAAWTGKPPSPDDMERMVGQSWLKWDS